MTEAVPTQRAPIAAAIIVADRRVLLVRRRIAEGELSWQFPAGGVEPDETVEGAAVREAFEETGLTVAAMKRLGERVHPATSRAIVYVACDVVAGTAQVADEEDLAELAWSDRLALTHRVPYPLFGPVQDYLDAILA